MPFGQSEREATLTYICLAMLSYPQVKTRPLPDRAATRTLFFDYHGLARS